MRRFIIGIVLIWFLVNQRTTFGLTLDFDAPVVGTIGDKDGLGTGFTHRLPRTGGSIPTNDPNLDLTTKPGSLLITSTRAALNLAGFNLDVLEAPSLFLNDVGTNDLKVSALVRGIQLGFASDHLSIHVGTASNDTLSASIHHGSSAANNTYVFTENWSGSGFGDDNTFNSGFFELGDTILLSLHRNSGLWSMSWENQTHPELSGSSPPRSLPWLDSSSELYFGLHQVNPNSNIQRTNEIEFFQVLIVPEPATWIMMLGMVAMLMGRRTAVSKYDWS